MTAVLSALRRSGIQTIENSLDCDAAIIWSVLWHGRMIANREVYRHYRSQDKPVVIIDVGTLNRGQTWKVAINHINALGYQGQHDDLDWDRPRKLDVSIQAPIKRHDHILIAAQHQHILQWQGLPDLPVWIEQQIDAIREHTDRTILIRPHPRSKIVFAKQYPKISMQIPRRRPETYDDFDMDLACHAVINHNSGPGIKASLIETPVVVHETSLAHPLSINLDEIDDPPCRDRDRWLVEICHTEYTVEELTRGFWLERLASRL